MLRERECFRRQNGTKCMEVFKGCRFLYQESHLGSGRKKWFLYDDIKLIDNSPTQYPDDSNDKERDLGAKLIAYVVAK